MTSKAKLRELLLQAGKHTDTCKRCRSQRACLDLQNLWDAIDRATSRVIGDCIIWHRANKIPLSDLFRKLDRIVKAFQGRDK